MKNLKKIAALLLALALVAGLRRRQRLQRPQQLHRREQPGCARKLRVRS